MNGLKAIRKEKGMTLQEVAKRMGCTNASISMYESGARTPSIKQIPLLAKAYKTTTMKILNAICEGIGNEQGIN